VISEKTVELNLTAELMNWLWWVTKEVHFTIAPSQKDEGKIGFDAAVLSRGGGVLIQYKRAYVDGPVWTWKLNRTKMRDQHARLQQLEYWGFPVLYAFPFFHLPIEVATWRRRLLTKTFWFRPSYINPKSGPTGFHDVTYDRGTGKWYVSSEEPTNIHPPETQGIIVDLLEEATKSNNIKEFVGSFNKVIYHNGETANQGKEYEDDPRLTDGMSILVRQI